MQWGIAGFSDSLLTYMKNSSTEDKAFNTYKNDVKDTAPKLAEGAQEYMEEGILK